MRKNLIYLISPIIFAPTDCLNNTSFLFNNIKTYTISKKKYKEKIKIKTELKTFKCVFEAEDNVFFGHKNGDNSNSS
jgi:hypothetical protein